MSESVEREPQEPQKVSKLTRYYYKHREEILEKRRLKKLEDPVYQEKQRAKEEAKRAKREKEEQREEEKKRRGQERARAKAERLGIQLEPSGMI